MALAWRRCRRSTTSPSPAAGWGSSPSLAAGGECPYRIARLGPRHAGAFTLKLVDHGWSDLDEATVSTYTVPASLLAKKLTVTVTARRTGYADGTATSSAITVAKGVAPKATKLPAITGTAKVGRTLTASHGTWTPSPTSYTHQWYADGKAIKGATEAKLLLKPA
jgi:hypothetical protein